MTAFNLMHCQPDSRKLVLWASRQGWLPAGGDLGYALHAALHRVFGERVPKPFYYRDARAGLLAYTRSSAEELHDAAALCAAPDLADALGLDAGPRSPGLGVRAFPLRWNAGRVLGFEVRVRPMRRYKTEDREHGTERDAYREDEARAEDEKDLTREAVYARWLAEQFGTTGAAKLIEARMTRFQLTPVLRRTQPGGQGDRGRKARTIIGPDATFSGHLRVEDTEAFARLLMRGVGRHRAFGFGMLLLKPASISP
ncbi:type I-E CRISPR-associated protein Cas6/Cse3/CasE [Caballeronia sp. LZ029]|uniref:type I-E CRISPR-associated protein Cas6/Cse3/CasE n=1 Tax=Caballeronia sp. LZ029 TaxID=3038564 RepID=UPI002864B6C5|nr:type I-E CRISPR-associated protein Cas6/Cse3/CasE [Caballeronia sp. LZ029]MDR5748103.1 type I-E CRISPR-associated protein Cas6/Cse3/CasE [Caballeronia sp. LZ029]